MTRITQTGRDWTVTHRDHVATSRRVRNLPMARKAKRRIDVVHLALWIGIWGSVWIMLAVLP